MTYRKRYEDNYLDDEKEEFEGDNRTDAEKLVGLITKPERTPKDEEWVKKLTERLFVGAKLPGPPGEAAVLGLPLVGSAYFEIGDTPSAIAHWIRISETAAEIGNKDLYYRAMDEVSNLDASDEIA